MWPERMGFATLPGAFRLGYSRCRRIYCTCTQVKFVLEEISPGGAESRPAAKIEFRVDVPTWGEVEPPERAPEIAAAVAEFLRDFPESEREQLREWYREREWALARLNEFRMDPRDVETGRLIDFREVLGLPKDLTRRCPLGEYDLERGANQYVVIERCCSNPDCDCREVHLSFLLMPNDSADAGDGVTREEFTARMSLDGRVRLHEVYGGRRAEAQAVLNEWRRSEPIDSEYLGWRYEKIKAIGRRSLAGGKRRQREDREPDFFPDEVERLEPVRAPQDRVGRNSPCPCGSGKKYKKCCGPKKGADA